MTSSTALRRNFVLCFLAEDIRHGFFHNSPPSDGVEALKAPNIVRVCVCGQAAVSRRKASNMSDYQALSGNFLGTGQRSVRLYSFRFDLHVSITGMLRVLSRVGNKVSLGCSRKLTNDDTLWDSKKWGRGILAILLTSSTPTLDHVSSWNRLGRKAYTRCLPTLLLTLPKVSASMRSSRVGPSTGPTRCPNSRRRPCGS